MNSQRILGSLGDRQSITLVDAPISGNQTTLETQRQLQEALGQTTCTNSIIARTVELFAMAIMVTLVFIFLQLPPVEAWFARYIPDFEYRLITKALLFFVIVYLLDRLTVYIRAEIDICDFRDF